MQRMGEPIYHLWTTAEIEVDDVQDDPTEMEIDHQAETEKEKKHEEALGGEKMEKHIIRMGEQCDSYQSIIKGLMEKKTKNDIEGLGKSHIT